MKKPLLIALSIISFQFANAQEEEKSNPFNLNIGTTVFDGDPYEFNGNLGLEYKFKDESSIGFNFMYREKTDYMDFNPKDMGVNFTFNHDWSEKLGLNTKKWDLYTGFNFSITRRETILQYVNSTEGVLTHHIEKNNSMEYTVGGQLGARYFITKNIGINAELNRSFDTSGIKVGTTIRF